jgi:glycosyltransferase involved in cell wall biosynthesis
MRAQLDIPQDARVLLFTAHGIRQNPFKDYQTMRAAVALVAERRHEQSLLFIALGEDAPTEQIGHAAVRFVPFQNSGAAIAAYYQAADIYVHAARVDTFPNTVLEALACGTPVVATAVGGIPEQVKGLQIADSGPQIAILNRYGANEATGILVSAGDARGMALGIERLLNDDSLRDRMGENAAKDAQERFDLQRQADEFLGWYEQILRR